MRAAPAPICLQPAKSWECALFGGNFAIRSCKSKAKLYHLHWQGTGPAMARRPCRTTEGDNAFTGEIKKMIVEVGPLKLATAGHELLLLRVARTAAE